MFCCTAAGQSPAAKESPSGRKKGSETKRSPVHESNTTSKRTHKVISTVFVVLIAYRWSLQFLSVIEGTMATDFTELCVVLMKSAVPQEEDEQVDEEFCDKVSWL